MSVLLPRSVPIDQLKLIQTPDAPLPDPTVSDAKSLTSTVVKPSHGAANNTFYVEHIIDHKGSGRNRQYLVKWHGYGPTYNSWEPFSSFEDQSVVTKYVRSVTASKAIEASRCPSVLLTRARPLIPAVKNGVRRSSRVRSAPRR